MVLKGVEQLREKHFFFSIPQHSLLYGLDLRAGCESRKSGGWLADSLFPFYPSPKSAHAIVPRPSGDSFGLMQVVILVTLHEQKYKPWDPHAFMTVI